MSENIDNTAKYQQRLAEILANMDSSAPPQPGKALIVILVLEEFQQKTLAGDVLRAFLERYPHDPEERPDIRLFTDGRLAMKLLSFTPGRTILLASHTIDYNMLGRGFDGLGFLSCLDVKRYLPPDGFYGLFHFACEDRYPSSPPVLRCRDPADETRAAVIQRLEKEKTIFSAPWKYNRGEVEVNTLAVTDFVLARLRVLYEEMLPLADAKVKILRHPTNDRQRPKPEPPTTITVLPFGKRNGDAPGIA